MILYDRTLRIEIYAVASLNDCHLKQISALSESADSINTLKMPKHEIFDGGFFA